VNFTELDKLAYVVRGIENDCAVCPIGSYKLTPSHELQLNNNFYGLSVSQASSLAGY